MLSRRALLIATGGVVGASGFPHALPSATADTARAVRATKPAVALTFDVAERMTALECFNGRALPLWTFNDNDPTPVVRVPLGAPLTVSVKNNLPRAGEDVTIHWHGLRIPNGEDGVPFMTQTPIAPGQSGSYAFVPPETGTYFFHTHCNSVEHFGRGLTGVLIIEGDEARASDRDLVLVMKDWRVGDDGAFLPFSTDAGAAKAGTPGVVRSINGARNPTLSVPAGGDVRLRLLNIDPVRISDIGVIGATAVIIAIDGNACAPMPLGSWRTGPATRLDILVRTPVSNASFQLVDYFAPRPVELATFVTSGTPVRASRFRPTPLKAMAFKKFDVAKAERIELALSATATGESVANMPTLPGFEDVAIGKLCLSDRTFWALNKRSWASGDHQSAGPPIANLKQGNSYVFEIRNLTPHAHPIHIHGHTFEVLKSNLRQLPRHRADTVLVLPKERIDIGLVADNPGRWMVHCHILEHQETGMMGYVTVS